MARHPPQARAGALIALREALVARRSDLAGLVTADMGKTLADASAEVGRGIESVEAAIAAPHLLKGENLEGVARGVDVEMVRQPVGVVAAITPFNFPAMIPLWFLPYAVVCGNTFILKPSELDPLAVRADLRAGRRDRRDPARGLSTSSTARTTRSTACSTSRGSTRSASSAGRDRAPRRYRARRSTASACRRSAAPRTRWS